ncbi:regulator of G-protein signaling 22-like [Rhinoraja longicauda]
MTMEHENISQDKLTTEPPAITADNFEDYLVLDDLLVDYFNTFLSLLSFPTQIWYNKERQHFEIFDSAEKNLLKQLKGLVRAYKPIDPIYNVTGKPKQQDPKFEKNITAQDKKFDDKFIVQCLDREQGVAWIKGERLPAFLKSDCYFEYRLAKLLSQLECKTGPGMPQVDQSLLLPKLKHCSQKQMKKLQRRWLNLTVEVQTPGTIFLKVQSEMEAEHNIEEEEQPSTIDETKTHEDKARTDDNTTVQNSENDQPSILNETEPDTKSTTKPNGSIAAEVIVSELPQINGKSSIAANDNEKGQGLAENLTEEIIESDSSSEEDNRDFFYVTPSHSSSFKNRKGIEKFKKFILGTAGEKYWWLWLDIDRLKVITDDNKRQRYLNIIQNRYLFSNGEYYINAEARARLGLSFISQWSVEKLYHIQNDIAEPLLLYWGPRYCVNKGFPIRQAGIVLKDWEDRQLRPNYNARPFPKIIDKPLLGAKIDCTPKPMRFTKYQEAICSYKMDDLLQALQNESKTGFIFTRFCEQTKNPLWRNAVHLWYDLREYQLLFFAEIFQPFKLRRQAQYIFATYIVDGSSSDIDIDTENRNITYKKLDPPFEDLFDQIEEYILITLLVPRLHMIDMDTSRFRKVQLTRETRVLDSAYYKKLHELQKKIWPNEEILLPARSPSQEQIPDDIEGEDYWQKVPEKFRNYTLDVLINNRIEMENFQTFLKENFAGLDLNCWLDIENFRRIPHTEKKERGNKSKDIKTKYLNRKYFFGPTSPATNAQQHEIMKLAGGWGTLLHEHLSSNVLTEIQRYIKVRMERKWLPMFLATAEFAKRHHIRVKIQDVVEDQMFQQRRRIKGVLKLSDNKIISTTKEIIAFRKALLNPVTTLQFRQFVSLKGDLMENNVIFWIEIQKYKDMCHSKASDENIQNKITAIINCFINSNIPPALQVNIPPECAYKIINERQKQGIYIFREAQIRLYVNASYVQICLWLDLMFSHKVATSERIP